MNINNERTLEHGSFNIKSQILQLENGINRLKLQRNEKTRSTFTFWTPKQLLDWDVRKNITVLPKKQEGRLYELSPSISQTSVLQSLKWP